MIVPSGAVRVLVATRPVDFRKGTDGLAALVQESLGSDPYSGVIYVFRAKRADRVKLDFEELAARFKKVGEAKFNPFMFQAKVDRYEFTVFPDGRAIIKGTNDPAQAKTIYAKYIGV